MRPVSALIPANDAANFAGKVFEDGNRWLAQRDINIAERYKIGKAQIAARLTTAGSGSEKFDLVINRVPLVDSGAGSDVLNAQAASSARWRLVLSTPE